ncbi:N-acetylneuraminate synthase family protein [Gammaproteobacteria bacterium]|nr:N-acetylneuraminate synthase family protein [Gammaproteobacteria bacterium]
MIFAAKKSGANAVKFQNFVPEEMTLKSTEKALYQKNATGIEESHYEMLEKYTLKEIEYKKLKDFSKENKIDFISTPFDFKSLQFLLKTLNLKRIKVSSTDVNNIPLLIKIGESNVEVIISSGMSTIDDVDLALSALSFGNKKYKKNFDIDKHKSFYTKNKNYLKNKVTLMHCTSEYPAPAEELNLSVLETYRNRYKIKVGYSDHSCNELTPVIATSLGISEIEVHVTIDKNMKGPDHLSSLDFNEFKKYVNNIRKCEIMLGSNQKIITQSEKKNIAIARKSLAVHDDLKKGERLTKKNLVLKRPGNGISPVYYYKYLNKRVKMNLKKNTLLKKGEA